jgi:hypothetical protein
LCQRWLSAAVCPVANTHALLVSGSL